MIVKIEDIKIPQNRPIPLNLDDLAESVDETGPFYPIVVTEDNVLVSGLRQLLALWRLGRCRVRVHVLTDQEYGQLLEELDSHVQRRAYSSADFDDLFNERRLLFVKNASSHTNGCGGDVGFSTYFIERAVTQVAATVPTDRHYFIYKDGKVSPNRKPASETRSEKHDECLLSHPRQGEN